MNAVEIEEAISKLAEQPFDAEEFPFAFLEAFGNKATTIKKLRAGATNSSDLGGVLQRNHIHIKVVEDGAVAEALAALKTSPATTKARAKFILATDGKDFQAEDLNSGEVIVCDYTDFPDHFGFFLTLAGINTVKQIRESAFDIKATGRLNRLYVELLKDNPEWGRADRRHDMNHFMARLIFCFFAEDTDIFTKADEFTATIERMSEKDSSNTHEIISELFRSMNTKAADREKEGIARWAKSFPYVNGGLFSESVDVPRFSKIARSYLLHIGNLDWKKINPDIFGSMIQAVADDEERGALGMHYTSVPNILKVLNPLFLDDLREKLEEAGDNARKLLNLRNRMAKIRVFDPACGSGNFLVIAYKEMRAIEAEINERRNETDRRSEIPLTNFRGVELRDFPAEIARLALIIAEYQCDVLYRGQREALRDFLPLDAMNWITCGNALRIDWLSICPPTGTGAKLQSDDLFSRPFDQAEIDFENKGGETFICGNPPYAGKGKKSESVLADMDHVLLPLTKDKGYIDYSACWLVRARQYLEEVTAVAAFVLTNSVNQGQQVPQLWPLILKKDVRISFARRSFKWSNNATNNAGVMCAVIGLSNKNFGAATIFDDHISHEVESITPYLTVGRTVYAERRNTVLSPDLPSMQTGSVLNDGGHLLLSEAEASELLLKYPHIQNWIRRIHGAQELTRGLVKHCLVISDDELPTARMIAEISARLERVSEERKKSKKANTRDVLSKKPHSFEFCTGLEADITTIIPTVTSSRREWLPIGVVFGDLVIAPNYALYDQPLWNFSLLSSRMQRCWVASVCGRLKTDFRYSNTLGWNIFPVPKLTEKNKADLTRCGEDILLARDAQFPSTIAELYDPEKMPAELRAAHERNDEALERIYIGRRFKNDTERLEKLFELYTKMTKKVAA